MANKANAVLGQLKRAFSIRDKQTTLKLYVTYVRPHLEFAIQAWCPWTEGDINLLEAVQKRAVNMIYGIGESYDEKLKELKLTTLRDRRIRGDAIETYKILNGHYNVEKTTWFEMAVRGVGMNTQQSGSVNALKSQRSNLEVRKNFFSQRSVNTWNALPERIRDARSVNQFKSLYDEHKRQNP